MKQQKEISIQVERFLANFSTLSQFGASSEGGVNRPAFSDAHLQAREWFRQQAIGAGLSFHTDASGNQSAFLDNGNPAAKTLLIGSHLDSVYNGGRFDGALGVMAAFEVLQTIKESNISLPFHLEAIDFSDEEGTLVGMLGSKALTGMFKEEMLEKSIAGKEAVLTALNKARLLPEKIETAQRDPKSLFGYLELHIEQGMHLDKNGIQIGIVTGIVGMRVLRVTFFGKANHAGTTAMDDRLDAGLGASALNLAINQLVLERFPNCVVTVGQMQFKPGGVNIIPGEASLSLDFRSVDHDKLNELEQAIIELSQAQANRFHLQFRTEKVLTHEPANMDPGFQDAIETAAGNLSLSYTKMASGAGHDAQNMAGICPSGMIFVPSAKGISHSPYEYTSDQDCINGANAVLQTVLNLALTQDSAKTR